MDKKQRREQSDQSQKSEGRCVEDGRVSAPGSSSGVRMEGQPSRGQRP